MIKVSSRHNLANWKWRNRETDAPSFQHTSRKSSVAPTINQRNEPNRPLTYLGRLCKHGHTCWLVATPFALLFFLVHRIWRFGSFWMTKMANEMSQHRKMVANLTLTLWTGLTSNVQLSQAAEYFGATVSGNLATEPFSQTDHHLRWWLPTSRTSQVVSQSFSVGLQPNFLPTADLQKHHTYTHRRRTHLVPKKRHPTAETGQSADHSPLIWFSF